MNTVEPVAWMTESEDGAQMFWPTRTEAAHYCDDDEQPTALYQQSTIDCRTCGRYWPGKNKCGATVLCQAGSQYTPSGPVLLFLRMAAAERVIQREETCKTCNGSGWVTRDPDIGTDRECSV